MYRINETLRQLGTATIIPTLIPLERIRAIVEEVGESQAITNFFTDGSIEDVTACGRYLAGTPLRARGRFELYKTMLFGEQPLTMIDIMLYERTMREMKSTSAYSRVMRFLSFITAKGMIINEEFLEEIKDSWKFPPLEKNDAYLNEFERYITLLEEKGIFSSLFQHAYSPPFVPGKEIGFLMLSVEQVMMAEDYLGRHDHAMIDCPFTGIHHLDVLYVKSADLFPVEGERLPLEPVEAKDAKRVIYDLGGIERESQAFSLSGDYYPESILIPAQATYWDVGEIWKLPSRNLAFVSADGSHYMEFPRIQRGDLK